jgi:enoyl-CoA hydratase/carnithine racemase
LTRHSDRLSLTPADGRPGVVLLELHRPPVNAFDEVYKKALVNAAMQLRADPAVRAVVVHGGERFSAGDDIKEMHHDSQVDAEQGLDLISEACSALAALPVPVVAAVRGFAVGGGCEVALACDFRISSPLARWGLPEVHLGLIPGGGGTQRLPRLVGPAVAKRLILLGETMSGEEGLAVGLVDEVVADDEVLARALDLASELARRAPLAVRAAKRAINEGLDLDLVDGLALESRMAIEVLGSDDARTGLTSFLQHGPGRAHFDGQ